MKVSKWNNAAKYINSKIQIGVIRHWFAENKDHRTLWVLVGVTPHIWQRVIRPELSKLISFEVVELVRDYHMEPIDAVDTAGPCVVLRMIYDD